MGSISGRLLIVIGIPLLLVSVLLVGFSQIDAAFSQAAEGSLSSHSITQPVGQAEDAESVILNLPLVFNSLPFDMELQDARTTNLNGATQIAYYPDADLVYLSSGINTLTESVTITLQWSQNDRCDGGEWTTIYSDTLSLGPGEWEHGYVTSAPDCTGAFSSIVKLSYEGVNQTRLAEFAVNPPSRVIVSGEQGFDKCGLPRVEQMQTWWNNSPYRVFNLYLGGVSFVCKNNPLDAVWVRKVADQGWDFILTWVGPQAPCTSFTHRMSEDTAYQQGRQEAAAAAEAATELGFLDDRIIYYDLEAYGQDLSSCHNAVVSFFSGWTKELHSRGFKAGGYGASCSSFMTEWTRVNPPLDDVWIANWYTDNYDPNASVWNTACLANNLWDDHQRLRQYTGGHTETWGGESITMDSNVLDGEITTLKDGFNGETVAQGDVTLSVYGTPIEDLGLFSAGQGWVLTEGRLRATVDGGRTWRDITPDDVQVQGADLLDAENAWLVGRTPECSGPAVLVTDNGGGSWKTSCLPVESADAGLIAGASIEALDTSAARVILKLQSGSSFNLRRLFSTGDGGLTWARQEPVADGQFDDLPGEMSTPGVDVPRLPNGYVAYDFINSMVGWAVVQTGACHGDKTLPGSQLVCQQHWRLLATVDGGTTWREITLE